MKAILYTKACCPTVVNIKEPVITNGNSVKIKIDRVGLCGSDIQKFYSKRNPASYLATSVLGHEIAGTVVDVGEKVRNVRLSDKVCINPLIYCNQCGSCKVKKYQLCNNIKSVGKQLQGGFAEYIVVPSKNVVKMPKTMTFDEACLNDIAAVVLHAYHQAGNPKKKKVLIVGDGSVALLLAQILLHYSNEVHIQGKHETNMELAYSFGVLAESKKGEKENYFDYVFETVGRKQTQTLQNAINSVKPGGVIIVLGVYDFGFVGKLPLRTLFYKEIKLKGSNSYGVWHDKDEYKTALWMIKKRIIRPDEIISKTIGLSAINSALDLIRNKESSHMIKLLLNPEQ